MVEGKAEEALNGCIEIFADSAVQVYSLRRMGVR